MRKDVPNSKLWMDSPLYNSAPIPRPISKAWIGNQMHDAAPIPKPWMANQMPKSVNCISKPNSKPMAVKCAFQLRLQNHVWAIKCTTQLPFQNPVW